MVVSDEDYIFSGHWLGRTAGRERSQKKTAEPERLWGARLDEGAAAGSGQEWRGARDAEGKWTRHKDMQSPGVRLQRRVGLETSDRRSPGKTIPFSFWTSIHRELSQSYPSVYNYYHHRFPQNAHLFYLFITYLLILRLAQLY